MHLITVNSDQYNSFLAFILVSNLFFTVVF
uniref:Uncharacterized protein n=1 Tax=Anguilla anguilla TaxID=7936 RepID=A0A0E9W6Z1_ANGAN